MCEVVSKTLLKNPLFSKKTHCFQTCALFYPIVLKRKIITDYIISPMKYSWFFAIQTTGPDDNYILLNRVKLMYLFYAAHDPLIPSSKLRR